MHRQLYFAVPRRACRRTQTPHAAVCKYTECIAGSVTLYSPAEWAATPRSHRSASAALHTAASSGLGGPGSAGTSSFTISSGQVSGRSKSTGSCCVAGSRPARRSNSSNACSTAFLKSFCGQARWDHCDGVVQGGKANQHILFKQTSGAY